MDVVPTDGQHDDAPEDQVDLHLRARSRTRWSIVAGLLVMLVVGAAIWNCIGDRGSHLVNHGSASASISFMEIKDEMRLRVKAEHGATIFHQHTWRPINKPRLEKGWVVIASGPAREQGDPHPVLLFPIKAAIDTRNQRINVNGQVQANFVEAVSFDCNAGYDKWRTGWSPRKKQWCCRTEQKGCPGGGGGGSGRVGGREKFDCDAGYAKWQSGWSPQKKLWCCAKVSKGCETHASPGSQVPSPGPPPPLVLVPGPPGHRPSAPLPNAPPAHHGHGSGSMVWYDCEKNYETWKTSWTKARQDWCCQQHSKGCAYKPQFNCLTRERWSKAKLWWCCHHKGRGCPHHHSPTPTSSPSQGFDCHAGADNWVLGWSVEKVQYCCNLGKAHGDVTYCEIPTTTTTTTVVTWLATTRTSTTTEGLTTLTSTTTTEELIFDCTFGGVAMDTAIRGWSDWKKRWCCSNQKVGCPPKSKHALSGSFMLEHLCYDDLQMHPLHRKLVWQTIKDSLASLLPEESLWVGIAKRRKLSESVSEQGVQPADIWLEDWQSVKGYMTVKFKIDLPEGMSYYKANSLITCERISVTVVPAVDALAGIDEMKRSCKSQSMDIKSEHCQIDLHVGKLPCTCRYGNKVSEEHCPAHGGDVCASCNVGFHLTENHCMPNKCRCDNGIAAVGATCSESGAVACGFCNPGYHLRTQDGDKRYLCVENSCKCDRGVAATGAACDEDGAFICASCDEGYHVDAISKLCVANKCYCSDGTPPQRGSATCTQHKSQVCVSCDAGYHVDPLLLKCVENKCTCDTGTAAVGAACLQDGAEICTTCDGDAFLHQDGRCGNKKCVCKNGVAVDADKCTTNRGNLCKSCDPGFALWGDTEQCVRETCRCKNGMPKVDCQGTVDEECQSCRDGFHLQGQQCVANECRCRHGVAAKGSTCLEDDLEVCSSCDRGFHHSLATMENGRTTVQCIGNTCSCSAGTAATPYSSPQCHSDGQEECVMCKAGYQLGKDHVCLKKQCTCENGIGTTGIDCPIHGVDDCESCDLGSDLSAGDARFEGTKQCTSSGTGADAFDCTAGYSKRVTGWSDLKKSWCCMNRGVGCLDYIQTGEEVCKPYLDASQCTALGCCSFYTSCQSKVGSLSCHPKRVIALGASAVEDEDRLCLIAIGDAVSVRKCNPYDSRQLWHLTPEKQLRNDQHGLCIAIVGDATEGIVKMEACSEAQGQKWKFPRGSHPKNLISQVTTLLSAVPAGESDACLSAKTILAGSVVVVHKCEQDSKADSQKWLLPDVTLAPA